jgi:hypothetical protein
VVHPGLNTVSIKLTQCEPCASIGGNNGGIHILMQKTGAAAGVAEVGAFNALEVQVIEM